MSEIRDRQLKEKGGTPGSARQEVFNMQAIADARSGVTTHRNGQRKHHLEVGILSDIHLENAYIEQAARKEEPFAVVMTVTPDMAERMLARNIDNRAISSRKVSEYASDMCTGRFNGLNGETIKIARDGTTNDGQHRLKAILESGVALRTLVVFGVDRASRMTVDQGKVRSMADYSYMAGIVNKEDAKHMAAVANVCHAYDNNALRGRTTGAKKMQHGAARLNSQPVTKAELLQYERDNAEGLAEALESVGRKDLNVLGGRARMATGYFVIRRRNPNSKDFVDGFFERLISGEGLASGNPILTLRKRLLEDKTYGHPSHFATLQIIVKAWNAHVKGERVQRFNVTGIIPDVEIA
jgi:hypothetical protein